MKIPNPPHTPVGRHAQEIQPKGGKSKVDLPPLQPSLNITDLQPRPSVHRDMPSTSLPHPAFSPKSSLPPPSPCPARPGPLPLPLSQMRCSEFTKKISWHAKMMCSKGPSVFDGDGNRKVGVCGEADSARQGSAGRV